MPRRRQPYLVADNDEKAFTVRPGRARRRYIEDRLEDKHGRSLVNQASAEPDWGREMENKLVRSRQTATTKGLFR